MRSKELQPLGVSPTNFAQNSLHTRPSNYGKTDPVIYISALKSDLITIQHQFDRLTEAWTATEIPGVSPGMMKLERSLLGMAATNSEQQNKSNYLMLTQLLLEKLSELCRWLLSAGDLTPQAAPASFLRPHTATPHNVGRRKLSESLSTPTARPATAIGTIVGLRTDKHPASQLSSVQPILHCIIEVSNMLLAKKKQSDCPVAVGTPTSASVTTPSAMGSPSLSQQHAADTPAANESLSLETADEKLTRLLASQQQLKDTLDEKLTVLTPHLEKLSKPAPTANRGARKLSAATRPGMNESNNEDTDDEPQLPEVLAQLEQYKTKAQEGQQQLSEAQRKLSELQKRLADSEQEYETLVEESQSWLQEREAVFELAKRMKDWQKFYVQSSFKKAFVDIDTEFMKTVGMEEIEIDEDLLQQVSDESSEILSPAQSMDQMLPTDPQQLEESLQSQTEVVPTKKGSKGDKGKDKKIDKKKVKQDTEDDLERQKAIEATAGLHIAELEAALALQRDVLVKYQEHFKQTRETYIADKKQLEAMIEGLHLKVADLKEKITVNDFESGKETRALEAKIRQLERDNSQVMQEYQLALAQKTDLPPKVMTANDPADAFNEQKRIKQTLQQADRTTRDLNSRYNSVRDSLKACQAELDVVKLENQSLQNEINQKELQVKQAQQEVEKKEQQKEAALAYSIECEEKAQKAIQDRDDDREELRKMRVDLHIANHSVLDFKRVEYDLIDKANQEVQRANVMKSKVVEARQETIDKEYDLNHKFRDIQQLVDTYRDLADERAEKIKEMEKREKELKALTKHHNRLQEDFANFAKARELFVIQASQEEEQMLALLKQIESVKIDEELTEVEELEYKIQQLKSELATVSRTQGREESKGEDSKDGSVAPKTYRRKLMDGMVKKLCDLQLIGYEKMLESAKMEFAMEGLHRQVGRLQVKKDDVQKQLNQSEQLNTSLSATKQKVEQESASVKSLVKILTSKVKQLEETEHKLKHTVEEKQNQLNDVTVIAAEREHSINWMQHQLSELSPKTKTTNRSSDPSPK